MVEIIGDLFPNNKDYDHLIDCVAEVSESRASELASGETFLKRGYQKFTNGFNKESLIYFGKSVKKLAKAESTDQLYFALMGHHMAYRNIGLLWAANNSIMAASSIVLKEWHNEGKLNPRLVTCMDEALKNELFLGRLPHLLSWHELFKVIKLHFQNEEQEEDIIPMLEMVDACLAVRLLHTPFEDWKTLTYLPDILEKEQLWLGQDTVLYMLGHSAEIEKNYITEKSLNKSLDEYYNLVANQPFKEQMIYGNNYLYTENIEYTASILGTKFSVHFPADKQLAIVAEIVLAYMESFLATAFTDVYPSTEAILIRLVKDGLSDTYSIVDDNSTKTYTISVPSFDDVKKEQDALQEFILKVIIKILPTNFIFKDAKEFLQNLHEKDEVDERVSVILSHKVFLENIFGKHPKIFLQDWKRSDTQEYKYIRTANPITIENKAEDEGSSKRNPLDNMKHNETQVLSIIDNHLWDQAHWQAFGFFVTPTIPIGIFLAFENGEAGKQIFKDWKTKFGDVDKDDVIRIAIIRGINKSHPYWYRVHVCKEFEDLNKQKGEFFIFSSKSHEMNAETPNNLTNLTNVYNHFKKYGLFPASYKNGGYEPHYELGITKTKLVIRDAWEVGEHDLDSIVIREYDDPIIPAGKTDAPIIELLKKKREK